MAEFPRIQIQIDAETLRFALALTRELALPGSVVLEALLRACDRGRAFAGPVVPDEAARAEIQSEQLREFLRAPKPETQDDRALRKLGEDFIKARRADSQAEPAEPEAEPDRVVRVGDRWRFRGDDTYRVDALISGWAYGDNTGRLFRIDAATGEPTHPGWTKC